MAQGEDLTIGADDGIDDESACDSVATRVIGIVAEVLRCPKSEVGVETRASDVEGWDSFGHVRIVLAVECAFSIKLSMEAIEKADSVAALVDAVERAARAR